MSDTPRTDALVKSIPVRGEETTWRDEDALKFIDHARQLERELRGALKYSVGADEFGNKMRKERDEARHQMAMDALTMANKYVRLSKAAEAIWMELRDRTHPDYRMRVASFVRGEVCSVLAFQELREALDGKDPAPEAADIPPASPYKAAE